MENKNGYGIFYGVIGVATLIVAIIGATFAYFSAQVTGNEFQAGTTSLDLDIVDEVPGYKSDMIPVRTTGDYADVFPTFVGTDTAACKDLNNNSICSTYTFTVKNPNATTAQNVYAELQIVDNDFTTENIKFAIYKGTAVAKNTLTANVNGTAVSTVGAQNGALVHKATSIVGTTAIDLPGLDQQLSANGGSATYTVVMWVEEAGTANAEDTAKSLSAKIYFTTDGGGTGVTGLLVAA